MMPDFKYLFGTIPGFNSVWHGAKFKLSVLHAAKIQIFAWYCAIIQIWFSMMPGFKSLNGMVPGFKPGQRKVIFTCIKRNIVKEIKVAQLAGSVGEHSAYHHGEVRGQALNLGQGSNSECKSGVKL